MKNKKLLEDYIQKYIFVSHESNNIEIQQVFFELLKPIHFKVINIFGPEADSV